MLKKIALITGITGQDGRYCANLLLSKGYYVIGTTRDIKSLPKDLLKINDVRFVEWDLINKLIFIDLIKFFKDRYDCIFTLTTNGSKKSKGNQVNLQVRKSNTETKSGSKNKN